MPTSPYNIKLKGRESWRAAPPHSEILYLGSHRSCSLVLFTSRMAPLVFILL